LEGFRFTYSAPLRFSDLDVLGHANHLSYLDILENARIAYYFDVIGLQSVHEIRFVLAELHIRYLASALLGQTLEVGFRTAWLKRSSSGFAYQIRDRAGGRLLAEGEGVQVYMDLEANQPEPLPEAYRERVVALEGAELRPPSIPHRPPASGR
jgi:acyl-CoA thioester hydrolase